ncbi:MAG: Ig-like domain-containing protein [Roseburia sp.]|nr:Ig-like domain-containing protein [Roseburia sp.]
MTQKTILRFIAVTAACLGTGVFALTGCNKVSGEHIHTWKYVSDGESGHHRETTCTSHDPINEGIKSGHDDADECKCGYKRAVSGIIGVAIFGDYEVEVGGKIQLNAVITPVSEADTAVVWSIEEGGDFAGIDGATGVLTGVAEGTVTVKAVAGGVSDTYEVEVIKSSGANVAVTGIVLDKGELTMAVGDADKMLTATIKPENATDKTYTWSSDDTGVVTVKGGVVHAVAAGTATITVTASDGNKTATCAVTVKEAEAGKDPSTPSDPITTPDKPDIPDPVQGGVEIIKASAGELETAYVEWKEAAGAEWYNVYISPANEDKWTKLDAPLIRQYQGYFRADAVGLKEGSYDMKVVPVAGDNTETEENGATARKITVYSHDRSGFAFENGVVPGAYKADGTLKDNARVIYVTEETKDAVSIAINDGKKDVECTGIQAILGGYGKGGETRPLAIRFVGNITDPSTLEKGDLQLDTKQVISNVTLEGIGSDATFNGFGLRLKKAYGVEVRNLGFMNCNSDEGDDLGLQQDDGYVWVHNCDFFYGDAGSDADQVKGDGALDTKKSTNITHSYNHFWDNGKCNLQGNSAEPNTNKVTYHHNWYDHSDSRHPRIRYITVHVYNNYFDGNAKYGVGSTTGSSVFVENNYFRSVADMKPMMISMQGTDTKSGTDEKNKTFGGEAGGMIKAYGNTYDCPDGKLKLIERTAESPDTLVHFDCYKTATRAEKVPASVKAYKGGATYNNFDTSADMYSYSVDTPEQAKEKVMRYAGRVDGGDVKWEFDNATEDANYAVIPELKALLTAYDDKILKIGK